MAHTNSTFDSGSNNRLQEIIEWFQNKSKYNRPNILKSMVNGSRYVMFYGHANKIYVSIDWNMPSVWTSDSLKDDKVSEWFTKKWGQDADAIIYPSKNYMVINNAELLERGANAFGLNFHLKVNLIRHWGTPTLYEGTKHAIQANGCYVLQYTDAKYIQGKWFSKFESKVIKRVPFFRGIKLDLTTLEQLNKCPKKLEKQYANWLEVTRLQRNARARARNANRRALERLEDFRMGDTDAIEMDDAFRLFNVSDRREVIAHFGMDTILASRDSKVINTDTIDGRKYELVQVGVEDVSFPDRVRWCNYLRMINPSTGEIHFEGVPNVVTPNFNNKLEKPFPINKVTQALAWRDGDDLNNYIKPVVLT